MIRWTPHDLPHLVAKSAAGYAGVLDRWQTDERLRTSPGAEDSLRSSQGMIRVLETAPLAWLDSDVCALVSDTHESVPEWAPEACMPGAVGMIWFEAPFAEVAFEHHVGGDGVSMVLVDGIGWEVSGEMVRIAAWSRMVGARDHLSPMRSHVPLHEVVAVTVPVARTVDVGVPVAVDGFVGVEDRRAMRGVADLLLSVAGSVWLLMSQPVLVEEGDEVVARVKRRPVPGAGGGRRVEVRVSVRSLSRTVGAGGGRRGPAVSRWWVRGHWRQQAWGRGRELRKPVFIAPHTAGARGVEVDGRPQVQVWRE